MMRCLPLIWSALVVAGYCSGQPVTAKSASANVQEFYSWYLDELSQSREPMAKKPGEMKKYVSAGMMADIQRRMKSVDGLDADPFLAAQDLPEDWKGNVAVSSRSATSVLVTLGKKEESRNRLLIEVRMEGGAWKIAKVERVRS
jgi:hypothetical protein